MTKPDTDYICPFLCHKLMAELFATTTQLGKMTINLTSTNLSQTSLLTPMSLNFGPPLRTKQRTIPS